MNLDAPQGRSLAPHESRATPAQKLRTPNSSAFTAARIRADAGAAGAQYRGSKTHPLPETGQAPAGSERLTCNLCAVQTRITHSLP